MTSTNELPALVTITLDTPVDDFGYSEDGERYGGRTVAQAIVAKAAELLVARLREDVRKAVLDEFKTQIVTQVAEQVSAVIAAPVRLTNSWGEPSGNITSVRQHIAEEVAKQLSSDSGDYHRNRPVLRKIIEDEVIGALKTDLSDVVKAARDKVVGKVQAHAAELIAKAVQDGLR